MAAVCCACTSLSAIVRRRRDMRTRSSVLDPEGGTITFAGSGMRFGCGAGAAACRSGFGSTFFLSRNDLMSCRVIWLPGPLPRITSRLTLFSCANLRAEGVAFAVAFSAVCGSEDAGCGTGAGAGSVLACSGCWTVCRSAPSPMRPSTSPTLTSSPSWRSIFFNTPAFSAPTSRFTLSVSSSTSASPASTGSPSFLSQRATVASTTDSPSEGTTIFASIFFPIVSARFWMQAAAVQMPVGWSIVGAKHGVRRILRPDLHSRCARCIATAGVRPASHSNARA